ncbi:hypothetical protein SOVF_062590 [Spinacia oleracea]|uniref:Transmembrane protein n=1 Tax=Spinacia oleracea TaxID=3562 RepID=A0A9R0I862_SPIOL|nr:uncharacterized protein LOC110784238 [Spinacia oleracea]KNA19326.1 hypothetical protein SOVF_062590 [Spinacia oleracea]
MTSSVMSSQSVILTTAMAVSGAVIFLSLTCMRNLPINHQNSDSKQQTHLPNSCLRSCLSSDDKNKKRKNKRVKFADNVKDHKSELTRIISGKKEKKVEIIDDKKIPEIRRMPANRAALYQGILRDRVHQVKCSY